MNKRDAIEELIEQMSWYGFKDSETKMAWSRSPVSYITISAWPTRTLLPRRFSTIEAPGSGIQKNMPGRIRRISGNERSIRLG